MFNILYWLKFTMFGLFGSKFGSTSNELKHIHIIETARAILAGLGSEAERYWQDVSL